MDAMHLQRRESFQLSNALRQLLQRVVVYNPARMVAGVTQLVAKSLPREPNLQLSKICKLAQGMWEARQLVVVQPSGKGPGRMGVVFVQVYKSERDQ